MAYTPLQFRIVRPLVDVRTAAAITNLTHRELRCAVESGAIRYAFDVATKDRRCRYTRILTRSLFNFVNEVREPAADDTPARLRQVVGEIIPALAQTLSSPALTRILCCDPNLLHALIREEAMRNLNPRVRPGAGHNGFKVPRADVIEFLIGRRILP